MLETSKTKPTPASQNIPLNGELSIKGLRASAHLGWTETERSVPQPVSVDVIIRFDETPPACRSDQLEHTVCYDQISNVIRSVLTENSFHLLERLTYKLHRDIKVRLPGATRVWIRVTKVHPPIPELEGGAGFAFGDFIPEGA